MKIINTIPSNKTNLSRGNFNHQNSPHFTASIPSLSVKPSQSSVELLRTLCPFAATFASK